MNRDGNAVGLFARHVLKRVVEAVIARKAGKPVVAPEMEFLSVGPQPDPAPRDQADEWGRFGARPACASGAIP